MAKAGRAVFPFPCNRLSWPFTRRVSRCLHSCTGFPRCPLPPRLLSWLRRATLSWGSCPVGPIPIPLGSRALVFRYGRRFLSRLGRQLRLRPGAPARSRHAGQGRAHGPVPDRGQHPRPGAAPVGPATPPRRGEQSRQHPAGPGRGRSARRLLGDPADPLGLYGGAPAGGTLAARARHGGGLGPPAPACGAAARGLRVFLCHGTRFRHERRPGRGLEHLAHVPPAEAVWPERWTRSYACPCAPPMASSSRRKTAAAETAPAGLGALLCAAPPCPPLRGMRLHQALRYSLALLHPSRQPDASRPLAAHFGSAATV